ncbi:MAG TPA: DUF2298 domain-containing protein [Gaiellaceae bacterium]|nr:DUF2298 domain-containing protein [Gaiellaceae bacterium]
MIDALSVWLLVAVLGLVALPFAELLFPRLPGRGVTLAIPLGLLLAAYPAWLLASLHVVPYGRASALAAVALVAAGAVALGRRYGLGRLDRADGTHTAWLASQALFTGLFAAWALMRSYAPDVWQTEKPMDMAFVNATNASESFPPHDPWQSGEDLNYYYYGHYLVAFVVRLTGVDPAVGFNLGIALFFALVGVAVFGVTSTLYAAARMRGDAPPRSPIVVGLVGTAFALLLGNLEGGVQFLQDPGRFATYDWWAPSRVIDGTANEFPYFSFLLADLHAHVLVTPFTLVCIAYAIQLALHGPPASVGDRPSRRGLAELGVAALVLGVLYPTNSFDFPTAVAIAAGALVLWSLEADGRWQSAAAWGGALLVAAVVLYFPFWLAFSPPADGVGVVRDRVRFTEFARDYASIYGLSLWVLLALFVGRLRRVPVRYVVWAASASFFLLVLLAPPNLSGLTLALVVAAAAVYMTFASGSAGQPERVLWLLSAVALLLVVSGEIVYVRDVFDGSPSFRFNTVFKTGYQAWFLLAIVGAVGVFWSARWLGRRLRVVWLAGLGVLLALALVYPVAGSYSRSGTFAADPTLDGIAWLRRAAADDVAAIEWLRENAPGHAVVLETVGNDFDAEGRARVSTFTGLATVLGWSGHEVQWGHEPGSRAADIQTIYRTANADEARTLLDGYGVRYVFIGSLERADHAAEGGLAKFSQIGTEVFRSGDTVIYELSGSAGSTR